MSCLDAADVCEVFIGTREGVGDDVRFSLQIFYVGSKFRYAGQLICLSDGLRVGLFPHGGNKALVISIEREWTPFNEMPEMADAFEGREQLPVVWRPRALMRL